MMDRRLCRLPRLLHPQLAAPKPHHLPAPINPSPAPLPTSPYSPPAPSFRPLSRFFCSSEGNSGSSMVEVGSAESFANIHSKVEEEKLPAVFYYTAIWCGPCRAMAPVVAKLSKQYPKIPLYKVDIDMEGLDTKLRALNICSVPTFHLYHKGLKTMEVVGADVKRLEAAVESLNMQQQ